MIKKSRLFLVLTGDRRGVHEGLHDLRIHVDPQVLLLDDSSIPSINAFFDPLSEDILHGRVDHVAEPLLWELLPLLLVRQEGKAFWMLGDELLDLLDG